ncbi:hypothetical protein [Lacihabitans soyangensis]|nr:hypothetical protein [Lacihabitans soyangensis]
MVKNQASAPLSHHRLRSATIGSVKVDTIQPTPMHLMIISMTS